MTNRPKIKQSSMAMSQRGRELLAEWEGIELNVYRDFAGLPTIGVGHLLTKDELSSGKIYVRGVPVKYANGLTESQAMDLLTQDLRGFEASVNVAVRVPLQQHQFDALVSFAFNVGRTAFEESTLLKEINRGRLNEVPGQFRRWIHSAGEVSPGLVNRRAREIALWSSPTVGRDVRLA